jgi:hypothetical protein
MPGARQVLEAMAAGAAGVFKEGHGVIVHQVKVKVRFALDIMKLVKSLPRDTVADTVGRQRTIAPSGGRRASSDLRGGRNDRKSQIPGGLAGRRRSGPA